MGAAGKTPGDKKVAADKKLENKMMAAGKTLGDKKVAANKTPDDIFTMPHARNEYITATAMVMRCRNEGMSNEHIRKAHAKMKKEHGSAAGWSAGRLSQVFKESDSWCRKRPAASAPGRQKRVRTMSQQEATLTRPVIVDKGTASSWRFFRCLVPGCSRICSKPNLPKHMSKFHTDFVDADEIRGWTLITDVHAVKNNRQHATIYTDMWLEWYGLQKKNLDDFKTDADLVNALKDGSFGSPGRALPDLDPTATETTEPHSERTGGETDQEEAACDVPMPGAENSEPVQGDGIAAAVQLQAEPAASQSGQMETDEAACGNPMPRAESQAESAVSQSDMRLEGLSEEEQNTILASSGPVEPEPRDMNPATPPLQPAESKQDVDLPSEVKSKKPDCSARREEVKINQPDLD